MEPGWGFWSLPSVIVCCIVNQAIKNKYSCSVFTNSGTSDHDDSQILVSQNLPQTPCSRSQWLPFRGQESKVSLPIWVGSFKAEIEINYCDGWKNSKTQAQHVEVYEPNLKFFQLNSTVAIPGESIFVILVLTLQAALSSLKQIVIKIPQWHLNLLLSRTAN